MGVETERFPANQTHHTSLISLSPQEQAQFEAWLDARNVRATCTLCDVDAWVRPARVFRTLGISTGRSWAETFALRRNFILRTCRHCGHVQFFDVRVLDYVSADVGRSHIAPP